MHSYSERLVQKITSPFYGSLAQDKIAVVLIDKESLRARGENWPPRYIYYEEVIRRIAKQKPAAIFLDVLVEDVRSYDESLSVARKSLGDTLTKAKVPLYLASLDNENNSVFNGVPWTQSTLSGWRGFGDDYPLIVRSGQLYDQSDKQFNPNEECDFTKNRTVALQIYQQLCSQGLQKNCSVSHEGPEKGKFCNAMVVQWGRNISKIVSDKDLISESQCSAVDQGVLTRIGESLRAFSASFLSGYDEDSLKQVRQPCPYTVTIREEDLSSEKARGVLAGRVVMIGLSLSGIHDIVESPVHGQIPGVYLHAMALDNLLTWDSNYFSRSADKINLIFIFSIIAVCWLCVAIIRAGIERSSALLRLVAILSIVVYISILYFFLHRPPPDWLAMLLIFELIRRFVEKSKENIDREMKCGAYDEAK